MTSLGASAAPPGGGQTDLARLDTLNRKIEALKQEILPTSPYILRLQGSWINQRSSHHFSSGIQAQVFAPAEQELQYVTFLPQTDGLLQAHGQWDDGNGGIAKSDILVPGPGSGANTPQHSQSAKKKISLADYKSRDKSRPEMPPRSNVAEGSPPALKREASARQGESGLASLPPKPPSQTVQPAHEASSNPPHKISRSVETAVSPPRRSSDASNRHDSQSKAHAVTEKASQQVRGRNEEPFRRKEKQDDQVPSPPTEAHHRSRHIPPMLSPTLPTLEAYKLPPLLSPNLPPEIEEVLARRAEKDRIRDARDQAPPRSPKLVVILRFKKKQNRRELSQYLRLKPTPSRRKSGHGTDTEDVSQRIRKRDRFEDEHELPKKRRRPSLVDPNRVSTPNFPTLSSPPRPSDAHHRRDTGESYAMRGPRSTSGTSPEKTRQDSPRSLRRADSPGFHKMRADFHAEFQRLINLGREVKHDSDAYLKKFAPTEKDLDLGLCIATESLLCFILAALVGDEPSRSGGGVGDTQQWNSFVPFLSNLKDRAQPKKYIYSILCCLEGVIRGTLYDYESRKMLSLAQDTEYNAGQASVLRECVRHHTRASKAWQSGLHSLWVCDIERDFPRSWARARRNPVGFPARSDIQIGRYGQDQFTLPMGPLNDPMDTINACSSILEEYSTSRKVGWKAKLRLSA